MSIWKGAVVLLTGATGSFGQAFLRHALEHLDVAVVRCFSRDEFKQAALVSSLHLEDRPRVRTLVGDVRDLERLTMACRGVRIIVHAAALKRVDAIAYDPEESLKTNVQGSRNVLHAALASSAQRVVLLSTDKGCHPANLYGATKMMAEHLFSHAQHYVGARETRFCAVRYGNVLGSRGSVIPLWVTQALREKPLTVTDPGMTRFWISLEQACRVVAWTVEHAGPGEVVIPVLPRATIGDMALACWEGIRQADVRHLGEDQRDHKKSPPADPPLEIVGERPGGEKRHECLLSQDEARIARAIPVPDLGMLSGYRLRHGDVPRVDGGETPHRALYSNTPPLLDQEGCLALLRVAGLVPAVRIERAAA